MEDYGPTEQTKRNLVIRALLLTARRSPKARCNAPFT
jgi:hypothetical protein